MKKRIFSGLLAALLLFTLVIGYHIEVWAATYRPGTSSSSYTTPNVGDVVYLNPKVYEYSSGSNSERVALSSYSFKQEKNSSTPEHQTGNDKLYRSVAYIYHASEDVRIPAYSKAVLYGYVTAQSSKNNNNAKQNVYACVLTGWQTGGSLGSLQLGQGSNQGYVSSVSDSKNAQVTKSATLSDYTVDNSGNSSAKAPDLILVGWGTSNKPGDFNNKINLYMSNSNQAYIGVRSITNYIYYHPNGGSGSVTTVTKSGNASKALASASQFSRVGYYISSWNTKADGTGTKYSPGASYSANAGIYLYAQWSPISYTVSFNANGGTGSMSNQSFKWATAQNLKANAFTYSPKVTFNANGGSVNTPSATVAATFNGWEDRGTTTYGGTTYKYTDFDAPGYAIRNNDVFTSGYCSSIYNKEGLLNHYVNYGKNEYANGSTGRAPTTGYLYGYPNGAKVSNLTTTNGGTVPLYAKWKFGTTTLPEPTYTGYTFRGWKGNLKDIAVFTNGMEINNTARGTIGPSANYAVTQNLIPVVGGTTYTSNYEVCGFYSYDANGNFIRRESSYSTTHTVSPNAAFVRIEVNLTKGISFEQYQNSLTLTYTLPAGTSFPVGGNQTLVAQWEATKYTVTWKDWDGSVLETDAGVTHGTVPSYNGAAPARSGNEQTEYTFTGWNPAVGAITGDTTYTAVYSESAKVYGITVENEQAKGTVVVNDEAAAGSFVPVLITPNNGYGIDTLTVFKTGDPATAVEFNETACGFTMPAFSVTVQVTFQQMPMIYSSVCDSVAPTFTVTIPATVELGNEITVYAEHVRVNKGSQVEVSIADSTGAGNPFSMTSSEGYSFAYHITVEGTTISSGAKVLVVNPDTASAGQANLKFEKPQTAIYAGTYTGSVIFTIAVKSAGNT